MKRYIIKLLIVLFTGNIILLILFFNLESLMAIAGVSDMILLRRVHIDQNI